MQNKNDLIVSLLFAPGSQGEYGESVKGITRLMKLLFLVNKSIESGVKLEFEPFKMGPYSSDVYSALEFFQNYPTPERPIIEVVSGSSSGGEKRLPNLETKKYMDDSLSEDSQGFYAADSVFRLTELGKKVAKKVWDDDIDDLTKNNITVIKKQFGSLPLRSLLKHVYDTYPDMTVNSEIKDSVYGK